IRPPLTSRNSGGGLLSPASFDPRGGMRRTRSNSSAVDIKAINARLERWAEEIASKFKIGKNKGRNTLEDSPLEIVYSVFVAPEGYRPITELAPFNANDHGHITKEQFDAIMASVRQ